MAGIFTAPPRFRCAMVYAVLAALLSILFASAPVLAQEAAAIFQQKCVACHTIGQGVRVGPDLLGVTERRDRSWLQRYLADPEGLLKAQDPIVVKLFNKHNKVPMPNPQLSPAQIDAMIDFLAKQSGAPAPADAAPAGPAVSISAEDAKKGRRLFYGLTPLTNGGPACGSCHTAGAPLGLAGGGLGPDLTNVRGKLGIVGLQAALQTTPFVTMQPIYADRPLTPDEQRQLAAFLTTVEPAATTSPWNLALLGLVVAGLGLALVQGVWHGRLTSVRRQVVKPY